MLRRVALELAVCEGALLERSEPPGAVVRLAEDTQPEKADGDHEHRGPDERDEELRVDRGRQPADAADESVVAQARAAAPAGRSRPLRRGPSVGHDLRD